MQYDAEMVQDQSFVMLGNPACWLAQGASRGNLVMKLLMSPTFIRVRL